jgi:hypothetical protein
MSKCANSGGNLRFLFVVPKVLFVTALVVVVAATDAHGNLQGNAYRVGSQKQLFIDELLIGSKSNVTLTMNPPVKTQERNVVAEHPWEELELGWVNVLEDNGVYKMWYGCESIGNGARQDTESEQESSRVVDLCYATSEDGIKWQKPTLGLVEFRGSKLNNIVKRNFFGTVFLDPKRIDGNFYKLAGSRRPNKGLEIFTSRDGLRWEPFKDQPVLSKGYFDTQNQIFWDKAVNAYVTFVRRWVDFSETRVPLCCRKVGRSVSRNLSTWPEPEIVYGHDDQDPVESDPYNSAVVKYPGAPNVYLMFPSAYFHIPNRKNDGPLDIQLATSRDGIKWQRIQREPYVRLGIEGSFDDGSIYMAIGMFIKGPEVWMYYVGYDFLHGLLDLKRHRHTGVISRVVQRLDGFVSADAAYTGGELTTIPIVFEGSELSLNLDTGALGEARVEILDTNNRVIPGFSAGDSDPINGNYIDHTVTWKGKKDVSQIAGKAVKLRLVMRSTKLYAFQFRGRNTGNTRAD